MSKKLLKFLKTETTSLSDAGLFHNQVTAIPSQETHITIAHAICELVEEKF